jgi:outer membrane lipoprotein-sorting protein
MIQPPQRPCPPTAALRRHPCAALLLVALAMTPAATAAEKPPAQAAGQAQARQAQVPAKAGGDTKAAIATGEPARFSVDMVMTREGETYTIRRAVDGPKSRMDFSADGQQMSQILLGDDAGTTYMLMPSEKRAIKQSLAASQKQVPGKKLEEKAEPEAQGRVELLGRETVDGRPADKYRVVTGEGSGLMWIDAERNLPLRMEAEGAVVQFKNYEFGPQKPELFLPPKGWEVMDMDEMMKGMPQGMPGMGGMVPGMTKGVAGAYGGGMGGVMGEALGGALGGPVGSMIGQYVGQRVGSKIGESAAGAVTPGK